MNPTRQTRETLQCILENFIPKDDKAEETDHHKRIRTFTEEPMGPEDDREFTSEEIRQTIKNVDHQKAPGEDGITSQIPNVDFWKIPSTVDFFV